MSITKFFKKAFNDMKESTKEQHKVDKANFEAAKLESIANFKENTTYPNHRQEEELAKANSRIEKASKRIEELN